MARCWVAEDCNPGRDGTMMVGCKSAVRRIAFEACLSTLPRDDLQALAL